MISRRSLSRRLRLSVIIKRTWTPDWVMRKLPALAMVLLFLSMGRAANPLDRVAGQAEKEMTAQPQEALLIARQAANQLANRGDLTKRLFATAAHLQEERLADLGENQLVELAGVYAGMLADAAAADACSVAGWSCGRHAWGPEMVQAACRSPASTSAGSTTDR